MNVIVFVNGYACFKGLMWHALTNQNMHITFLGNQIKAETKRDLADVFFPALSPAPGFWLKVYSCTVCQSCDLFVTLSRHSLDICGFRHLY